jgi:hypothetical protein
MRFSDAVIDDLARVWARLHRSAAVSQLQHLIRQMRMAGDLDGVANYGRILKVVTIYNQAASTGRDGAPSRE